MILDNTTRKIQLVLGGAITTNQPIAHVTYFTWTISNEQSRPAFARVALNNTTDVDLLAAPATQGQVREVKSLHVYNKDTASATVTVKYDDGGTETEIIKSTLTAGQTLIYEQGAGWQVL